MTQLTGSTKRGDWERRWGHELPRDWEKGRIHVDGDEAFQVEAIRVARWISTVLAVAFCAWFVCVVVFAL